MLITAIGVVLILPVWIVRYPPLVDYPNHLARYFILSHLHDPNMKLAQFYASRWIVTPYVAVDVLAVMLGKVLPIYFVGRVILSLSLVAFPLAAYLFLRQVGDESRYLAAWVLVITYGPIFLASSMNGALSTALCFFLLAAWLKRLAKPWGWASWLWLLTLATLLYLTHLVGFVIAGLIVAAYCLWTRQSLPRIVMSGVMFAPGIVLYAIEYVRGKSYWLKEADPSYRYHVDIWNKIWLLVDPLRGYSHLGTKLLFASLLISVAVAIWKNRDMQLNSSWLGVSATMFLMYLCAPSNFHNLDMRIVPFLFVLGMTVAEVGPRARVLGLIGLAAFLFHSVDVDRTFISRQAKLERLHRSFDAIPPYSKAFPMVPMSYEPYECDYLYFWAYGVIERGWFSPFLFHSLGIHTLVLKSPTSAIAKRMWPQMPIPDALPGVNEPDWPEIEARFDYLWVLDIPRFSEPISRFGQLVYSDGSVKVFRILPQVASGINAGTATVKSTGQ